MDGFPGGGEFQGRRDVGRFLNEFVDAWGEARYEIDEPRVVNGCVVGAARWEVTGRTSGAETTLDFFSVSRYDSDGLLTSLLLFWNEDEALAEATSSSASS